MVAGFYEKQSIQILVIEADPLLKKALVHSLKNLGVNAFGTDTADAAIRFIKRKTPPLVIYDMEDSKSSMSILEALRSQSNIDLLLLCSERLNDPLRNKLQPKEVIYKPFDTRFVCRRVLDLLSQKLNIKESNAVNINK